MGIIGLGYYRRDRIRRLVGLYGCAVEGWEGGDVHAASAPISPHVVMWH